MSEKIIEITSIDGIKLDGYLTYGEKRSKTVLIQVHGMTSNCFKKREKTISESACRIGVDTICINTRGSEIVKYISFGDGRKELAGTAYEDVEDSYYDILGTIKYAISLGYSSIYLQGHSLGSTKIVYTYNKMINNNDEEIKYIKGILLLSLVDIPGMFKAYSKKENLQYAGEKEKQGDIFSLMPADAFFHPISVKTYLRYTKYYENIDFAQYGKEGYDFNELNRINVPLFMRWGNNRELILKSADEQVELLRKSIKNENSDIDYINGADHSYSGMETELANQISNFIEKCNTF